MKYIKTKDIDTLIVDINQKDFIKEEYIIKEGNTIEELCDAYVLDEQLFYRIEDLKLYIKQLKELNHWTVDMIKSYGAIWTDKGLIYVAKMNKIGKLELIEVEKMTVNEKLIEEFGCAISAVLGINEDKDVKDYEISADDIDEIARKVKFYLDLK